MFAYPDEADSAAAAPFQCGEEAWFWAMAVVVARGDGAGLAWRPDGPPRPCEPDDVIKCLDSLYHQRVITLEQVRNLRIWGERQVAPLARLPGQAEAARLWRQSLGQMEWVLRKRGIVH